VRILTVKFIYFQHYSYFKALTKQQIL